MRKFFNLALATAFICGASVFTSCSSDDNNEEKENIVGNLTPELLAGLWVTDNTVNGAEDDVSWTRVVEDYQFNADGTGYYECYQLDGEDFVKATAIRDNDSLHFTIDGYTVTITGDKNNMKQTLAYTDGRLTVQGKVIKKATAEQQTLVDQLYAEWSGANSSSSEIGYIECSWDGTKVVKTPRTETKFSDRNLANRVLESAGSFNYIWLHQGTFYVDGKLNIDGYLYIEMGSRVNLILCDGCELKVKGIVVQGRSTTDGTISTLRIYGQDKGTGRLIIDNPGSGRPGIGPYGEDLADIEIHGGVITAKGAPGCAGIGGGYHDNGSYYSAISIYNGTIDAQGGDAAAGIGSSVYADGGVIYIYGGDVTAQGGNYNSSARCYGGAGIGGSNRHNASSVRIYGGNVKATGGTDAAGIGAGENAPNGEGKINIYGGTVTAQGADYAAGIGGGDGVRPGPINISGGTVYAYAGKNGAGIGGGEGGESGDITITGGTVRAYGDRYSNGSSNKGYGAGIGSGQAASVNTIIIKGGDVQAYGGEDGAGIGTGEEYGSDIISGTIEIHGGKVFAQGKGYGAGIGAGEDATFGVLGISGGRVDAHAGSDCGPWSGGIGAYHSEHEDGCHIGWAGWERIYIGACMRLWTYSPNVGHIENVHYTENWWNFVHQRPQVAFGECNHVDGAYDITNCPYCHSYTLQLK